MTTDSRRRRHNVSTSNEVQTGPHNYGCSAANTQTLCRLSSGPPHSSKSLLAACKHLESNQQPSHWIFHYYTESDTILSFIRVTYRPGSVWIFWIRLYSQSGFLLHYRWMHKKQKSTFWSIRETHLHIMTDLDIKRFWASLRSSH